MSCDFIAIGYQFEAQAQDFGSPLAHEHALGKDFKIINHRTNRFIELDVQSNDFLVRIDMEFRRQGGIIDAVVFVEGFRYFVAHTAAADITL